MLRAWCGSDRLWHFPSWITFETVRAASDKTLPGLALWKHSHIPYGIEHALVLKAEWTGDYFLFWHNPSHSSYSYRYCQRAILNHGSYSIFHLCKKKKKIYLWKSHLKPPPVTSQTGSERLLYLSEITGDLSWQTGVLYAVRGLSTTASAPCTSSQSDGPYTQHCILVSAPRPLRPYGRLNTFTDTISKRGWRQSFTVYEYFPGCV